MNKWIIQIIMLCFLATLVACQPQQVKENSASSIQGTEKSPADVYVSLGVE